MSEGEIALIGFGEAAEAFLDGWGMGGSGRVRAFDVKSLDPAQAGALAGPLPYAGALGCASPAEALAGAGLAFCLVTADQALAAAEAAAPASPPGHALARRQLLRARHQARGGRRRSRAAGGRYVDMAIMAPVHPRRHATPVLLAGPAAGAAAARITALGMPPTLAGARVGDASTIKMLRSVMVKGIEAPRMPAGGAARRGGGGGPRLAAGFRPGVRLDGALGLQPRADDGARAPARRRDARAGPPPCLSSASPTASPRPPPPGRPSSAPRPRRRPGRAGRPRRPHPRAHLRPPGMKASLRLLRVFLAVVGHGSITGKRAFDIEDIQSHTPGNGAALGR